MSDPRPQRVRVTGPPRRTAPRARLGDIDEQTQLGEVYLRSLMREQLSGGLRVLVLLLVGIASWPLLFHWFPSLAEVDVAGVSVAWWLMGVVVYPVLVLLGWRYVRRAERVEQDFADLLSEPAEPRAERAWFGGTDEAGSEATSSPFKRRSR